MYSAQFRGEIRESLTKRSTRLSRKESVKKNFSDKDRLPPVQIWSGGLCAITVRPIYAATLVWIFLQHALSRHLLTTTS